MNWIDAILVVMLLASVVVGSRKGLIRELMAFAVFFVAIIVSINYVDSCAVWIYQQIGGSVLVTAFLSFVILLTLSYAAFKLLGMLFYKIASIKQSSRRDQMGGALVGFLRGWVAVGFLTFLVFLLPMPDSFYDSFEQSFFGPAVAKTVPLMFESTARIHPQNPNFLDQIEKTLLGSPGSGVGRGQLDEDRVNVHKVLYNLERFFDTNLGPA